MTLRGGAFVGAPSRRSSSRLARPSGSLSSGASSSHSVRPSLPFSLGVFCWLPLINSTPCTDTDAIDIVFDVVLWTAVPCLLVAQIWGARVTYGLAARVGQTKASDPVLGDSDDVYDRRTAPREHEEEEPLLGSQAPFS